jgi:L-rhamnose isomerase
MAKIAAQRLDSHYRRARQAYSRLRVNTDAAIQAALTAPISLSCGQADDVGGYGIHERFQRLPA